MPASPADRKLVAAARGGDKAAFAELALRHRPLVLAVCTRFLGDRDVALDVVQEATVVALVSLSRLEAPERFGSWLCGIALNVARGWLRDQQRRVHVPLEVVAGHWSDPGLDPSDQVELAELGERVRGAVVDLAPGQREAVLLFYLRGLTYWEVAAELGISVNAVKARLHQARGALEPRLEPAAGPRKERLPMVTNQFVSMEVVEVRRRRDADGAGYRNVVVLQEPVGDRRLPIWVGPAEATALALSLETIEMPRPMTYELTASLVAASGAALGEVRITRLDEGTFYAVVLVDSPVGPSEIDARPSDAINLAVVAGVPIRVDAALLGDAAAVDHPEWQDYEDAGADIVADIRTYAAGQHQCR